MSNHKREPGNHVDKNPDNKPEHDPHNSPHREHDAQNTANLDKSNRPDSQKPEATQHVNK